MWMLDSEELAFIVKLYGEFSIREPIRMVPGLIEPSELRMPSGGQQNGSE